MKSLVGQTLGAYRILEQIGRGGMATVFKAYQPALDRYVAVKVLPPHLADEPGFAQRFKREARAVAQLEHPHILAVHDSGQDNDLSYLVMRYVEAGTLKAQMGHPLDLERVTDLISQISEALDYAHEKGIVHRDIKPSNILMDREDWALLSDFGLAKMMEGSQQITETGVGLGTPDYMSPEQGLAERVDRRSDIYSLGVVLYEMLTGRVPFKADTPMAVVLKHIHDPLPLPREVNPEIPEAIERVVLKAMAKDPRDRFERARDLAKALREASKGIELSGVGLTGTSVAPSRESLGDVPAPRFFQRVRNLVWMLPVTLAIVALGFVFTRIPIRVQIVGGRLEIVSAEQGVQSIEPTAELTRVPTVESTDLASEGALGEEGPMMAATYAPDAPLYDDFEGQSEFDPTKWAIWAISSPECIISQSNGVAGFSNQPSDDPLICMLSILDRGPIPFEGLGFVEAEFYASGDATGYVGNQAIGFFTADLQGENWYINCGLQSEENGQFSTFSHIANWGRDQESERFWSVPALSETWYRMRLEVDPEIGAVRCYVNDQLIESHVPKDVGELRDAQFYEYLISYREPGSLGTFWTDNVRISEFASPVEGQSEATPYATTEPSTSNVLFHDDFAGSLADGWAWVREDPSSWNLDQQKGFLRITAQAGGLGQINPLVASNILLRDAPDDDFVITTYIEFTPDSNFQFAGLLIYQDDTTALQLGRAYCDIPDICTGNGIYFDRVIHGEFGDNNATATQNVSTAYLRVQRQGSDYTGYFSDNGTDWIVIGQHSLDMSSIRIGLIAAQAYSESISADFDYFRIEAIP